MYLQLARRNDWTYSEQIDNAVWVKTGHASLTADNATAPNGTTTADRFIENASNSQHGISRDLAGSPADNTDQAISVFVKSTDRPYWLISCRDKSGAFKQSNYNLSTTTATKGGAVSAGITDVGNGWFRLTYTYNTSSGGSTLTFFLRTEETESGGATYTGDGTSESWIWGLQHELDQSSASGYASTEAAAFTTGVGDAPLLEGSTITWDAAEKMSRADLSWNADAATFSIAHGDDVIVDSHGTTVFVGQVVNFSYSKDSHRPGQMLVKATCLDHVTRLATTEVGTGSGAVYKAQSDRAILQDLLSVSGLDTYITSDNANVDIVLSSIDQAFSSDSTVRQAFDQLAARAGAEWSLDPNIAPATKVALHYNTNANAGNAAWDVSDSPSAPTTYDVENLTAASVFDEPGNDIIVVGGLDSFGRRIKASTTDATSISTYGTRRKRFSSDAITTTDFADDVAAALLAKHKDPYWVASYGTKVDGLHVNELQDVTNSDYGLSAESMFIRRIQAQQIKGGPDEPKTQYRVELGPDRTSPDKILRQVASLSSGTSTTPQLVRGFSFAANDFFSFPGTSDFRDPSTNGLFISCWVSLSALPSPSILNALALCADDPNADGWIFGLDGNGTLSFRVDSSGGHELWTHGTDLLEDKDTWQHVAMSWDGTTTTDSVLLWVDGVEDHNISGSGGFDAVVSGNVFIGVEGARQSMMAFWKGTGGQGDVDRLSARPDATIPLTMRQADQLAYFRMDEYADGTQPTGSPTIQDSFNTNDGTGGGGTANPTGYESHWNPLN